VRTLKTSIPTHFDHHIVATLSSGATIGGGNAGLIDISSGGKVITTTTVNNAWVNIQYNT
jgi:hypothetical protein